MVAGVDTAKVERVVLSATLITHMITEGKTDTLALVLIPGREPIPNPKDYSLGESIILDEAVDFRSRRSIRCGKIRSKRPPPGSEV
jgi:hypothetical protein